MLTTSFRSAVTKLHAFVIIPGQVWIVACLILEKKKIQNNQMDQRVCVISVFKIYLHPVWDWTGGFEAKQLKTNTLCLCFWSYKSFLENH